MTDAAKTGRSRPVSKADQIRKKIRDRIVRGRHAPGDRLPNFFEMEAEFGTGRAVIQQALAQLRQDGFVESRGRRGLFVTKAPPHLHQYGLLLATAPGEPGCSALMNALTHEAYRMERRHELLRFRFYFGIRRNADCGATIGRLFTDVREKRLAGLILAHEFFAPVDVPSLVRRGVPLVRLWGDPVADPAQGLHCITTHGEQLILRSLEHLKALGRRRVAILQMGGTVFRIDHAALYRAAGMEYRPAWVRSVNRGNTEDALEIIREMFGAGAKCAERPDGLVIEDDNLVNPASRGILRLGLTPGRDFDCVAHCNWPLPEPSVLPMERIGFDVRDLMERAVRVLREQAFGKVLPKAEFVPALFSHEIIPSPFSYPTSNCPADSGALPAVRL